MSKLHVHLRSPSILSGVRVTQSLILCACFVDRCLSFFFWPLCCLSFDLWILITLSLSSNSSQRTLNCHNKLLTLFRDMLRYSQKKIETTSYLNYVQQALLIHNHQVLQWIGRDYIKYVPGNLRNRRYILQNMLTNESLSLAMHAFFMRTHTLSF